MRKKILSLILTVSMALSMVVTMPQTANTADATERYIYDAETLPDGTIGLLFIYGGTSSSGVVSGGTLYFGIYDPSTNEWSQDAIRPGDGSAVLAKDATMALDSSGNPHVAYVFTAADTYDDLGYTYLSDASWDDSVTVSSNNDGGRTDGTLSAPHISIASDGTAHIAYVDSQGNNLSSSYSRHPDLMYRSISNDLVSTAATIVHGYCENVGGSDYSQQNIISRPEIVSIGTTAYIGSASRSRWGGSSTWGGAFTIYPKPSGSNESFALGYGTIASAEKGFNLYGMASDGTDRYSLYYVSGTTLGGIPPGLHIAKGTAAPTLFSSPGTSIKAGDITTSGTSVYAAGINSTTLILFQNAAPTSTTLSTAINTTHNRMGTAVSDGTQYIFYTGADAEKSLFIVSTPVTGGAVTEYRVPNKTAVTISGVTVESQEYNGESVIPGGTLSVTGGGLTAEDLTYIYTSTDGGGYTSTTPPTDAGDYKLVISVPEENATYTGSSEDINFGITQKALSITGTAAIDRDYQSGNLSIELDPSGSVLAGVLAADEANVSLDKSGVIGTMDSANAGYGKTVSVAGFALTGTAAGNYSLTQPTDVTVNINPITLTAPAVVLAPDSANGGLSATVSDLSNISGVLSYTVEIYQGADLKKTIANVTKDISKNIPLEDPVIVAELQYTAKAKAIADASGNYSNSALGNASDPASADYSPLVFSDNSAFDIPFSNVGNPITSIDFATGVTGGKLPHSFSGVGLPPWASISNSGVITGTPGSVAVGGAATITVTDAQGDSQSIDIAYGAVGKGDALDFAGSVPSNKTYGDAPLELELIYDGDASNVSYSVLSGPGSISGNTLIMTGAGEVVIRATGTSSNYADKTQDYTIAVVKKSVTITPTAVNNTKIYGGSDPVLAYTNTDLVGGDTLSGIILKRSSGENAGNYAISIAEVATTNYPNYQLSLAGGTHNFTITQKPLTITGASISGKAYDGTVNISLAAVTAVTLNGDIDSMELGTDFEATSASYTDDFYAGTSKPTTITISLKDTAKASNYKFETGADTYAGATANVIAANQTILADNQSLTVSNTLDLSTISFSNAPGAILSYAINGGTSDYATLSGSVLRGTSPGAVTININSGVVDAGGTSESEYSAAVQKQITITITAKENGDSTITFGDRTISYGETYTPNATTTLTGGEWRYNYSGTTLGGEAYSSSDAPLKAGSYSVAATYENSSYIGTKSASLTISAKTISITGVSAGARAYDGTVTVTIIGGTLEGLIDGDTVTAVVPATGTLENEHVGNNKNVTIAAITLAGADKDNYLLTQPTGLTVNITPKVITFTVDAIENQNYTGSQITPSPIVKDGGTVLLQNIHYTVAYGNNINAGTNAGTVDITGIGNYEGSNKNTSFTINKISYSGAAITGTKQVLSNTAVTGVTFNLSDLSFPASFINKSFNGEAIGANSDGLITGNLSIAESILTFDVASREAGKSGVIKVTVNSTNYNDYQVSITVNTVDKTPITINGVTVEDKTYDSNPVVAFGTPTNSDGYEGSYEYLYEGTGLTNYSSDAPPSNSGTYKLTVQVPPADHTYTGQQVINFTINKTILQVKPKNESIYTNDSLPEPIVEYVGLIGNDIGANVAILSSGSLNMEIKDTDGSTTLANSYSSGSYFIKFIELPIFTEAVNYTITTNDGILTISNRPSGGDGSSYTPPAIIVTTEEKDGSTINKTTISPSNTSGTSSAEISTVIIDVLLDKADATNGSKKGDILEVSVDTPSNTDSLKISMKQSDLQKIISAINAKITISSPFIAITFDDKALKTINAADSNDTVIISASIVNSDILSDQDKAKVANRPVYDFTVVNGKTQVSNFGGGHATVSIPYTLKAGENPNAVVVYYLADNGSLKTVRGHYNADTKAVVFKTTHFSKFVIGINPVAFSDVASGAWFKTAVEFIASRGITSGTGDNKYSPGAKLTRAQFIVLLMNAYQLNTQNIGEFDHIQSFTDAGDTYYTDYLLAAKGLGIVNGIGNNLFAPEKEITRQEMLVMLYNALKVIDEVPAATLDKQLSSFNDAGQIAIWANEALSVLVKSGVVGGSNNNLNPASGTTRAEIAQVLYNLLSK